MKTLLSVMVVVLAVASPLCASTVVFQENFDGTAGNAVAGSNGWTGASNILFSSAVLDQGNSASWATDPNPPSTSWPTVSKGFTYAPGAGEVYTLTATLDAPSAINGAYSDLRISSGSGSAHNISTNIYGYGTYSVLKFGEANVSDHYSVTLSPLTTPLDVKFVLANQRADYAYRVHGTSTWTEVGGVDLSSAYTLSGYNTIEVWGHGGFAGGMDSILLTAGAVPEPSAIMLVVTGLVSLLAYAWRKRK